MPCKNMHDKSPPHRSQVKVSPKKYQRWCWSRQVSWLGFLVAASLPGFSPVAYRMAGLSLTVAGPFRYCTGFPIEPNGTCSLLCNSHLHLKGIFFLCQWNDKIF